VKITTRKHQLFMSRPVCGLQEVINFDKYAYQKCCFTAYKPLPDYPVLLGAHRYL